nr:aminotransferase class I/II-fold pyridoxal phosphate-dependent enzyme [Jatrophihabitans endophyticus]
MASVSDPLNALSLDQLRSRSSMKWRQYAPDVLPLWVAEMDVPLAEPVARVLRDVVDAGDTGYASGTRYAEELSAFAERRWGWSGLDPARSALVADVMIGVVEVLRLVTGPGDAVVINPPVYPPFYAFLEHAGRRVVEAPLDASGRLDPEAVGAAFDAATAGGGRAAYLLCSPHNPTGTVHTAAELAAVARLAAEHRVRVVVDEIHAPLVLPGAQHVPYLSVPGSDDAFVLLSASKGWNLAGLKAAVAVAGPSAASDLARLPEIVSHGPSHLGVLSHTAALREGGEWLDALLTGLQANRTLLADLVAGHLPGVGFRPPSASFLAWLDCTALQQELGYLPDAGLAPGDVTSMAGPAAVFLERSGVALSAGFAFGTGGAGHVRLNFATSSAILTEAVERMAAALG